MATPIDYFYAPMDKKAGSSDFFSSPGPAPAAPTAPISASLDLSKFAPGQFYAKSGPNVVSGGLAPQTGGDRYQAGINAPAPKSQMLGVPTAGQPMASQDPMARARNEVLATLTPGQRMVFQSGGNRTSPEMKRVNQQIQARAQALQRESDTERYYGARAMPAAIAAASREKVAGMTTEQRAAERQMKEQDFQQRQAATKEWHAATINRLQGADRMKFELGTKQIGAAMDRLVSKYGMEAGLVAQKFAGQGEMAEAFAKANQARKLELLDQQHQYLMDMAETSSDYRQREDALKSALALQLFKGEMMAVGEGLPEGTPGKKEKMATIADMPETAGEADKGKPSPEHIKINNAKKAALAEYLKSKGENITPEELSKIKEEAKRIKDIQAVYESLT